MSTVVLCRRADNAPDAAWALVYNSAENQSFDWTQEHGYHYRYFPSLDVAIQSTGRVRIHMDEYLEFVKIYTDLVKRHPSYRFGQAFVNGMLPDGIWDPELFNLRDRRKAEELITARYIDLE